ncbi:MAG: homocysteine S-methyltransferase family protein [Aestuariivirgaceae bacterium]
MNRYDKVMHRIRGGGRILIDGATGTEIERRGVPQLDNAWNGGGALSHPDILRKVHEDYIRQGAEIVISNTFATSRHALRDAGVEDQFERFNSRGVELAIEAREQLQRPDVLVAGGISYWSWSGDHPPLDALQDGVAQQAVIMAAAGADLLMLEMMVDIDRMMVTLEAAQASGLPVWAGLSCEPDAANAMCLVNGEPLSDALAALSGEGVPLVSIMHTEVGHIDACLDVMQDHWSGPIGVYAHTGDYADGKWIFDDTISPGDYAAGSRRWLARGVQVIGGCCGIRVDHIAALSEAV